MKVVFSKPICVKEERSGLTTAFLSQSQQLPCAFCSVGEPTNLSDCLFVFCINLPVFSLCPFLSFFHSHSLSPPLLLSNCLPLSLSTLSLSSSLSLLLFLTVFLCLPLSLPSSLSLHLFFMLYFFPSFFLFLPFFSGVSQRLNIYKRGSPSG